MSERWKWIPGYEGRYQVSDQGRVRSVDRTITAKNRWGYKGERKYKGCLLKPYENIERGGYLYVNLHVSGKQYMRRISCLVAAAFVGPRLKDTLVCHNNGKRKDNRACNLRYGTHSENSADRIKHGNSGRGEKNSQCLLTEAQVEVIRRNRGYISQRTLANCFKVSQQHISNVQKGKRRLYA